MPIARDRVEQLQVQKLIYAVRTEDVDQIKKLCDKGVEHLVNYNDPQTGMTALISAVTQNKEKMIQYLLQLGAHPDVIDFAGRTALMHAAEYGHINALHLLRDAKANPKIQDLEGKDAVHHCFSEATQRHKACLKVLLEMGADVNNRARNGVPNLVHACANSKEHEDFCIDLIKAGADVRLIEETTKRTALHNACLSGSANVVRELLRAKADPNALDEQNSAPIHEAAKGGHFEVVQVLAGFLAKFDVYDVLGNNPIHYAATSNAGNVLRFLGQRGCNPKVKNLEGLLPKKIAEQCKAKDAKKNIRKSEKGYNEMTLNLRPDEFRDWRLIFYDYVYENQERLEKMFEELDIAEPKTGVIPTENFKKIMEDEGLLAYIKPEDLKDIGDKHEKERNEFDYKSLFNGKKYLTKPYLMAAFAGKKKKKKKPKKAKKSKGALPILIREDGPRTANGNPPIIYAPQHVHLTDHTRFSRDNLPKNPLEDDSPWYLDKPDKGYINICDAAYRGDLNTMLNAFKRGVPVDITDKFMKTPLMVACSHGDIKTVQFLLTCGAEVNRSDNFKWTPLHHAAHSGVLDVVQAIVDAGGAINAESITRATPLMRAIESSSFPVVEYLVNKGAKVMHENISGLEPLTVAAEFADPRIYHLLNEKVTAIAGNNKKGPAAKKKPAAKKRPPTGGKGAVADEHAPHTLVTDQPRRGSLLRAAAELAKSFEKADSIAFHPKTKWTELPTTKDLMHEKTVVRDRLGWEIDFQDYKMPFMSNLSKRLEQMTLPEVKI
ncbi:unnamed protein product [Adineta steineri]|uniref:Ankyrin repeat and EF-hand domain-containing protein 1 n=1 Tax=Adineta steineri TaxID=433720 RepID=A0A814QX47_9BILA|nr:unnamed protein product [Adineta steineri]CAF3853237.1 unnamed protein product [Adineta steineri]